MLTELSSARSGRLSLPRIHAPRLRSRSFALQPDNCAGAVQVLPLSIQQKFLDIMQCLVSCTTLSTLALVLSA